MVSGYPTFTSIPRVDGLSTDTPILGRHSTLHVQGTWERVRIFFFRAKGRVMHIAMHVKSMKRLPTHNVIYSIVQWYLKERHDLSEVPFWAIGDRKTVSS